MSLLLITDTHFRSTAPGSFVGGDQLFLDLQIKTLDWLTEITKSGPVEAVLHSGDLGNTKDWGKSYAIYNPVAKFLSDLKDRGIKFFTVVGQHDCESHDISRYRTGTMGALENSGLIKVLDNGIPVEVGNRLIQGYSFGTPIQEFHDTYKERIALVHATADDNERNVYTDSVRDFALRADLAFFGDVHVGFQPVTDSTGTLCMSAGALIPQSYAENGRTLGAYLHAEGKPQFLPSPLSKEFVFEKEEKAVSNVDFEGLLNDWSQIVRNMRLSHDETPRQFVNRIAETLGINQSVADRLLELL